MQGVLNYAAPIVHSRRGVACGIVSTTLASLVVTVPMLVLAGCQVVEHLFNRPGPARCNLDVGFYFVVIPTLAVFALSIIGLLVGTAGVWGNGQRGADYAAIGLIVNVGILVSAILSVVTS